ncbi:GIY-YIG nuclease family protein [Butyrivibrio sp. LC3010]|uniref:GIY-YIG nuclease family protein n=1 Tax=Butyrivibrio sp. LC3010 TaxID=1280680 RepID=UPI000415F13E|nr:GIY-YIG nuclease family protein [Butyrivibrio sp. LC3010]
MHVTRGAEVNRIYIIIHGIDAYRSRYKFAVRLTEKVDADYYRWEKVSLNLDQYRDRLILRCKHRFTFYNSSKGAPDFDVEAILPPEGMRSVDQFRDYDSVELTFPQLKEIVDNEYVDYYEHLSCVKAVYMIIDGNTGRQYVGSAYESTNSLWSRWSIYANTYHGNNVMLKELYEKNGAEYFEKFKYIILQIFPKSISDREIIEAESRFKDRFMTREFGYNKN